MADKVIKLKTDDELVLEQSNDSILEKALDYAVVEQKDENILAYSVSGLYTNEKNEKYNSPRKLNQNPPQLNIKDSNGNEVTFNLTKEYTNSLMKTLSEVNRAYHGYKYVSDKDLRKVSFKERIKKYFGLYEKTPYKKCYWITVYSFSYLCFSNWNKNLKKFSQNH